ncbi:MAG: 50S ribosomal protein L23 [Gemmatimonadota bacterium]
MSRAPRQVIIRPLFTEKTSQLQYEGTDSKGRRVEKVRARGVESRPKYTFEVASDATKVEIRHAIEAMFDVRVRSVRTVNVSGKQRRMGRHVGRRPDWKKAIVEVAEGTIDVFEGV